MVKCVRVYSNLLFSYYPPGLNITTEIVFVRVLIYIKQNMHANECIIRL